MCKIIHTDFKPENVVIGLKASEVAEIAKTGQLTSTKMQKNELLKKLNMKVAGTLPPKDKKNTENRNQIFPLSDIRIIPLKVCLPNSGKI
jgi:hypothetical protein